jgi:hypothetical protein
MLIEIRVICNAISKNKPGMVAYVCGPNYSGEGGRRIHGPRVAWAKLVRCLICKNKSKRA